MRVSLLLTTGLGFGCLASIFFPAPPRLDLSRQEAASLVGGEMEMPYEDACCVFETECDLTEILCSSNGTQACMQWEAVGYRVMGVPNRDSCQDTASSTGQECTETWDEGLECAFNQMCFYDTVLQRCVPAEEFPITVPNDCTDTCP